jgi:hypothetical protein
MVRWRENHEYTAAKWFKESERYQGCGIDFDERHWRDE